MKVKLLFFGATAASAGVRETEISLTDDVQADRAFESIFAEFPNLAKNHDKKSLHFSVNQEYASGTETINEGDELAVFTAVSGG